MTYALDINVYLQPISAIEPTGEDAKYEACYELMETEVRKFGSLFGETVDWAVVKSQSMIVLTQYSKDVRALCYLCRALMEDGAFSGLEAGLRLLHSTIKQFGGELFPRRKRARDGAIDWLVSQLDAVLSKSYATDDNQSQLLVCAEHVGAIQAEYENAFADSDVNIFSVKYKLEELVQQANLSVVSNETVEADSDESPASTPASTAVATESSRSVAVSHPTHSKPMVNQSVPVEQDIETDFSSIGASKKTLKKVAEAILSVDASFPLAYRIHRHLGWFDIKETPQGDDKGITPLRLAISQDSRAEYKDSAEREVNQEMMKRLEKALPDIPFWLTGHYYLAQMLTQLGHADAANAVRQETQIFVARLSGIETLSFADSVPFACEKTLEWLRLAEKADFPLQQMNKVTAQVPDASSATVSQLKEFEPSLCPEPNLSLDNLGQHVAQLSQHMEAELSGRTQFLMQLNMIKAFQSVNLHSLCLPYLETVWSIRESKNLIQWEPQLCVSLNALTEKTMSVLFSGGREMPDKYRTWLSV